MSEHHEQSRFSADVDEFLMLLHSQSVEYMIVGGEAVIYYGHARLTGDIDLFYRCSSENAGRLFRALDEFWGHDIPGIKTKEELLQEETVFQFGVPPNRIDLLNDIEGVSFVEAWPNRTVRKYDVSGKSIDVIYIGIDELIRNKKALRRGRDAEDLLFLDRVKSGE
jgi:hypothetical protein